jgi:hypothetical protein
MRLLSQRRDRARGQAEDEAAPRSANSRGAWYPDPFEAAYLRWWNGKEWTQQTRIADDLTGGSEAGDRTPDPQAEEAPLVQEIWETETSETQPPSGAAAASHAEADTTAAEEGSTSAAEGVETTAPSASKLLPQAAAPLDPTPSKADESPQPIVRGRGWLLNEAGAEQAVRRRPPMAAQASEKWLLADAATLVSHQAASSSETDEEIGDSTRWLPGDLTHRI